MGQKIHPIGFRLSVNKNWGSRWFANSRNFAQMLNEDLKVREYLKKKLGIDWNETTPDGRFSIMMPHPERVFRAVQNSWYPHEWQENGAWLRMFQNARKWVG